MFSSKIVAPQYLYALPGEACLGSFPAFSHLIIYQATKLLWGLFTEVSEWFVLLSSFHTDSFHFELLKPGLPHLQLNPKQPF